MSGENILVWRLPPNIVDLLLSRIQSKWKRFGVLLEVDDSVLDTINYENSECYGKAFALFHYWKEAKPEAKWGDVIHVLNLMDLNLLVNDCNNKLQECLKGLDVDVSYSNAKEELKRVYRIESNKNKRNISVIVDLKVSHSDEANMKWGLYADRMIFSQQMLNASKSIKVNELMKDDEKFVCLSGIAGIGKSTYLLDVSSKWAANELWQNRFDFVFHLTCREINRLNSSSLKEMLSKRFPTVFQIVSMDDLLRTPEKVLFILDGLDELVCFADVSKLQVGLADVSPVSKCIYKILNVFDGELLNHSVIVSGRPGSIYSLKTAFTDCNPKCVDVVGFDDNNIELFATKVMGKEKCLLFRNNVVKSETIKLMVCVPVYLDVMCQLFAKENIMLDNITELLLYTLCHYMKKHLRDKNGVARFERLTIKQLLQEKYVQNVLSVISKAAYHMLLKGVVVFNESECLNVLNANEITSSDFLENCGLLIKVEYGEFQTLYQFRHLVFQELCAAVHILKNNIPIFGNKHLKGCLEIWITLKGALDSRFTVKEIIRVFVESLKIPASTGDGVAHTFSTGDDLDMMAKRLMEVSDEIQLKRYGQLYGLALATSTVWTYLYLANNLVSKAFALFME